MICGGTMFGNCATGSDRSDTRPPRTVTIAITIATIGRRMKNAAMSAASSPGGVRRVWLGGDLGAFRRRARVDDHTIARRQATEHEDARAEGRAGLHRLDVHHFVRAD